MSYRRASPAGGGLLRSLAAGVAAVLVSLGVLSAYGQDESTALERSVKAAFLYKFAGYVAWPENTFATADAPLTIGVLADDPLAAELAQTTSGRTIEGRPVAVKRLRGGEPLTGIHILFVGRVEDARLGQILRPAQARPVLTVTEQDGALNHGSTINFLVTDGRVRFEIALDAAERRGLRLSSRLLTVAQNVRRAAP